RDYKVTGVQTCALPISASSTALLPTYLSTSDGAVLADQYYDTAIMDDCELYADMVGFQCAPALMSSVLPEFSDAGCTSHAASDEIGRASCRERGECWEA